MLRRLMDSYILIFWIICMILVSIPCVIIGKQAWNRYRYNPTVTGILRDQQLWLHTFPCVTICPTSLNPDSDFIMEVVYEYFGNKSYHVHQINDTDEIEEKYVAGNQSLIQSFVNSLIFGNFSTYKQLGKYKSDFDKINSHEYLELNDLITSKISKDFGHWNATRTITEFGVCYSLNSILAKYSTVKKWRNKDMSFVKNYKVQTYAQTEEEPILSLNDIVMEANIYFHSYNEIPTLLQKSLHLPQNYRMWIEVNSEKHASAEDIRSLSIEQRHCRFTDESDNLRYSPVYSYNLCRLECRMRLALKLCKCFPFYYRSLYGEPICTLDEMMCFSDYDYELIHLVNRTTRQSLCGMCDANCEAEIIKIESVNIVDWMFDSVLGVVLQFDSEIRLQRVVIFSETDFLVQVGGLFGLAYGIGILSVVELFYFCTLRFFWGVILTRIQK
ncbi:sodium channel protein Nach-like isoform X2 [Atheta coriaria]|uniref:sodium channel protein Nach-like isoform X2 n=1 Tax=Dalotia coriaria TaxID=877792 RepID=UPI0031F3B6AF